MLGRRNRSNARERAMREYGADKKDGEAKEAQEEGSDKKEERRQEGGARRGGRASAESVRSDKASSKADKGEGPLELETILQESRQAAEKAPRCAAMENARRKAALVSYYLPVVPFHPMGIIKTAAPPPLGGDEASAPFQPAEDDDRPAVQLHRSDLADAFPNASHFAVALVLHSFLQPSDDEGAGVPLEALHQLQAWARLSGFPETAALPGPLWHSVLLRWMGAVPGTYLVLDGRNAPVLLGVRLVHPSAKHPALSGWDALQLLSHFRCARLLDVPHAEPHTLAQLPLLQLWPTLGNSLSHTRSMIVSNGGRLAPPPAPSAAAAAALDAALLERGAPSSAAITLLHRQPSSHQQALQQPPMLPPSNPPPASRGLDGRAAVRFEQGARVEGSHYLEPPPPPPPPHLVAAKLAEKRAKAAVKQAPYFSSRGRTNNHMLRRMER